MRNLVLILVALIAVATFIRAYEAPRGDTTKSFPFPSSPFPNNRVVPFAMEDQVEGFLSFKALLDETCDLDLWALEVRYSMYRIEAMVQTLDLLEKLLPCTSLGPYC